MSKITTIKIVAKCSDNCHIKYVNEKQEIVAQGHDYVPDFMPEEHYGDYVELDIDIATGQVLNWKKPTQAQIKTAMRKLPGNN